MGSAAQIAPFNHDILAPASYVRPKGKDPSRQRYPVSPRCQSVSNRCTQTKNEVPSRERLKFEDDVPVCCSNRIALRAEMRTRIRGFTEDLLEAERDAALETGMNGLGCRGRRRGRPGCGASHRHGHSERGLMGPFGPVTVGITRSRLELSDGKTVASKNATIPACLSNH